MDGEDEVFSGSHSDDGSATPVQDENAGSDAEEEMRGGSHQSEDEGSDREDAAPPAGDSGSEHEDGGGGGASDSEPERPRPADSDDDDESSPPKRRGSTSETEEQQKAQASDSDEEPHRRRQSSDSGSDSDGEKAKQSTRRDSEGEDGEERKEDEEEGGRKAVINSDSEEEEERKPKEDVGSDQDEERPRQTLADSDDEEEKKPVKRKKAILSDSEDEEETKAVKKSRAVSDDDSDSDEGSEAPDKTVAAKLRELGSDSEEEDDRLKMDTGKKDEKTLFGSDSDSDNNEEEKMIADIFGESGDEEEEEFTGFNQEELEGEKQQVKAGGRKEAADDSDSDDDVDRGGKDMSFMSDFDMMLARKKAQSGKRRRHRDGGTFISDADDVVSAMITKMTEAAEEDRTLNSQKKPALKKLMLLPTVVMHLKKQDLKETFIDSGVMTAIKEWISPLPDKSLPALKIREELLKILQELPSVSQETLKMSGIGRAVMFLYKHPKESRANKNLALKLINEWSRPIFGLSSNYKGMTREERQQRDLDQQIAPRRRLSEPQKVERAEEPDVFGSLSSGGQTPRRDLEKVLTGEEKALRPGDPGFCARARVPMPSNKDYVVRPKWNVETDSNRGPVRKSLSRVDKQMRRFADIRRLTKPGHAVKISVEGNRMPL
ncbi:protein IWS1 homolog isoform X1 [Pygocentrus nattereri]|uniref:protein IWS1 homolog isoform X1 n=1 Tax=Pygocentrus nattereri TaxID=42514 RepID=UPI00081448B7|nr:protein IWS1 homolog isoform X1 [Pygocentrus nattereri]